MPIPYEVLAAEVRAGHSQRAIARRLGVSTSTVRHWLRQHGLETDAERRRRRRGVPPEDVGDDVVLGCPQHGPTTFRRRPDGGFRCLRCRSEAVSRRRRRLKEAVVREAGGSCAICGYDRCLGALEFHHLDPRQKRFAVAERGFTRSLAILREEAAKCLLLCGNCHAEVEAGLILPIRRQNDPG